MLAGMTNDGDGDDQLPTRPVLRLPFNEASPLAAVAKRVLLAGSLLLLMVLAVYLDRGGYRDADGNGVTLLDSVYYATVSLSTTGYGDIVPITPQARLVNIIVVTPLRVLFLIILVGTTLEVLAERTRESLRSQRWKARMNQHTVVVGYGTKGRSAVRALVADGYPRDRIVVVDSSPATIAEANADGLAGIVGDATRRSVLVQARVAEAERVLVSSDRDDTAVLVVLTVRQLNASAVIVSAVRESENEPLLRQSGASSVVVSSEAAGRLLALSAISPSTGEVLEDLLIPHSGLDVHERGVLPDELGRGVRQLPELVLAVVRGGTLFRFGSPEADALAAGDRLVVVRDTLQPHRTERKLS